MYFPHSKKKNTDAADAVHKTADADVASIADPLVSILRPFMDGKTLRKIYKAVIFTVALSYGIVFLVAVEGGNVDPASTADDGGTAVGLSSYGICWIKNPDTRRKSSSAQRVNLSNTHFIYVPVIVVFLARPFFPAVRVARSPLRPSAHDAVTHAGVANFDTVCTRLFGVLHRSKHDTLRQL